MRLKKSKWRIVVLILYALSIGSLVLHAQAPMEGGRRDMVSSLPDGEGKGLVLGTCVQCHNLNPLILQRKNATGWENTVRDMISRGAQVRADEIAPMVAYLEKNFGPDSVMSSHDTLPLPSSQAAPRELPEGAMKGVILRACTQCHGVDRITNSYKDEAGWRATVNDMVRLGAELRPNEVAAMIAYLTTNFPRSASAAAGGATKNASQGFAGKSETASENPSGDIALALPDGEGKGLLLGTCVQCHNLRYVVGIRKDAAGWKRTVQDMVARGAQLNAAETEIVANYLATYVSQGRPEK